MGNSATKSHYYIYIKISDTYIFTENSGVLKSNIIPCISSVYTNIDWVQFDSLTDGFQETSLCFLAATNQEKQRKSHSN